MNFDVVGFGALNLDKLFKVNIIAKEEEEGFVTDSKESAGGSAANTVVGLARLGLKTGFVGKVAADREGKILLEDFKAEGVDASGIAVSEKGRSGVVMGYVDPDGDRALYVDPGVNNQLDFQDIKLDYIANTDFLHLSSFVGETPFKAQKQLLLEMLPNLKVSFDPGALYARKGLEALKPIIKRCTVMFPNAIETKILTGENFEEGAKIFIGEGAGIVAVKLGKNGCYVSDGKESHLVEPYIVDVVDTTGAGDAFCAGFLYGLITGKSLVDCGRLGNFVASRCIAKMGARTGLPRLEDLKDL
jgi:ribokinase